MFGGRGRQQSGPKKGKPKLIELQVTLEEVYNGCMKTVKFKRYFPLNEELEFASPVTEREAKMCKNVPSAKAWEESTNWFNWAQGCSRSHRPAALTAGGRARP